MDTDYPYDLISDPKELARLGEWNEEVYRDFLAYREGRITDQEFRNKHCVKVAIFCLDMTGFTVSAIRLGELESLLRIFDVQRVAVPVLKNHGARLIRAFADDLVALFDSPDGALDAALETNQRVRAFNASKLATPFPAETCIGIGYGEVFSIGPNLAMGDEMNRASKLGEDTARGYEILVTANVRQALNHREDVVFNDQHLDDLPFPFFSVTPQD